MRIKKIIGVLHLWLGLASGLVIFVVSITGAIFVFSEDIMNVTERDFRFVEPQHTPKLLPAQLKTITDGAAKAYYGSKLPVRWSWISLSYPSNDRSFQATYRLYGEPDTNISFNVFVNPYTGNILKVRPVWAERFWEIIVDLHVSLMLGKTGSFLVRYGTLVFLLMVISGIVLWWPRNKPALKQRVWFRWKPGLKWKRKNYDLHNILGFYASWVVVFMIITGLFWAFDWVNQATYWLLDGGQPKEKAIAVPRQATWPPSVLDRMYQQAHNRYPTALYYDLSINEPGVPFTVYVRPTETYSGSHTLSFNPSSGQLLRVSEFRNLSLGSKFDNLSGDIHYGWLFGWPSKIAVFFACLITASLPISGFYIWLGRRGNSRRSRRGEKANKGVAKRVPNPASTTSNAVVKS